MRQESIMKEQKGMRKGISLVEMLIAIVLFGVITTTSFVYYKNYYDTAFAAKKLAISVVVDQATQLSNAYDMYTIETGVVPTTITEIVAARLLTETPVKQPAISASGWSIALVDINGTLGADDTVFSMSIDGTANAADRLDYCNILNNKADASWSVESNTSKATDQNTTQLNYNAGLASLTSQMEYFHCSSETAGADLNITFVKTVIEL